MKIIAESKQLQEAQELFELFQSDYIQLQRCSEELLYLKSLWDMVRDVWECVGLCGEEVLWNERPGGGCVRDGGKERSCYTSRACGTW